MEDNNSERYSFEDHDLSGRTKLAFNWLDDQNERILDAGCSYGYATKFYSKKSKKTFGIDISENQIEVAKKRFPEINFTQGIIENLPYENNYFDSVVFTDVLEHTYNKTKSLSEIFRVLKNKGCMILTVPHKGTFDFLDPYNYGFFLKKYFNPVYLLLFKLIRFIKVGKLPKKENPEHSQKHFHYNLIDIKNLFYGSQWKENYKIEKIHYGGYFWEPYYLNLERILALFYNEKKRKNILKRQEKRAEEDYWVDYGKRSYNIALKIRKI